MWQGECPGGGSSAGACMPLQPAVSSLLSSSSLSLFPSPHPHFLCTLSPFVPAICPPFSCSHFPSPSVFLCAFHPSSFHSVATLHLDTLHSLLPLLLALLLLDSLSLLDAPSAPLCSWVPFCSANTSCLVFLAVQQMFLQCCGDGRTKGSFHFSCGMERGCTAGLRGRRSGGSHAYIQPPRQPEH